MIKYLRSIFLALVCTAALVGCAEMGIRGPGTKEVVTLDTTLAGNYTKAQVRQAILRAGAGRQWTMVERGGSVIRATYGKQEYKVVIDITYTNKNFSIAYVDSSNMSYQETNGVGYIHSNYNRWIHNISIDTKRFLGEW